ncbi:uncharacterized protein LOC115759257 [Drosophila novamexicana]|uniref:uncharacterized protein LOC115759257 n=1 Tax=Drosophila novamexicana TaxID=47314 RepID=UPI0011E5BCAC|nr:uncharacterized protein LOC115759257 [Drosophila novamexicana]
MLVVRYLIALVFSIFMMATSLRIAERLGRNGNYKISTPDRLVLQMKRRGDKVKRQQLQRRRLGW